MSLDGSGLGGMAMAEAYTARKFHRENMKILTASTSTTVGGGIEDNGGGYSRWFCGFDATAKSGGQIIFCGLVKITERDQDLKEVLV